MDTVPTATLNLRIAKRVTKEHMGLGILITNQLFDLVFSVTLYGVYFRKV